MKYLHIELIKALPRRSFWILWAVGMLLTGIILYFTMQKFGEIGEATKQSGIPSMNLDKAFPQTSRLVFLLRNFHLMEYLVMIVLGLSLGSEFSFRTFRQNVIDGMSREEFFLGKILLNLFTTVFYFISFILVLLLVWVLHNLVVNDLLHAGLPELLGRFAVKLFVYGLIGLMLASLLRTSGLTIGVYFIYSVLETIADPLFQFFIKKPDVPKYFPIHVIEQFFSAPHERTSTIPMFALYVLLFTAVAFWSLKRRDI